MRKFFIILLTVMILAPLNNTFAANYSANYYAQDDYPDPVYPGQEYEWWIEFENTGTETWYNEVVNLGCGTDKDMEYDIVHDSWLDSYSPTDIYRPTAMDQAEVRPGEIARFTFTFHVPEDAEIGWSDPYNFTPVREGVTWMREADGTELDAFMLINVQPPPNNLPTGEIIRPSGNAQGNLTVQVSAGDADGLDQVYVTFVENGPKLVTCGNGAATSCSGNSGEWTTTNVNPKDYGVTGPGDITFRLWVRDDEQNTELAADKTISWSEQATPENSPPSGTITSPSGIERGNIAINASAADADGIRKVSAVFVPYGPPLVLCEDGTSNPCPDTEGSWALDDIDPEDYGASAGKITMGLHVQDDENGNAETLTAHKTFTWIDSITQFPTESRYIDICVGHNYEQQMPVAGVQLPSIMINGPLELKAGETVELSADAFVDTANGGSPFFYWCAERGVLQYDPDNPDKVLFTAPFIPGPSESITVFAQVGDGLGYVASDILTIEVKGTLTRKLFTFTGTIFPGDVITEQIQLGSYLDQLFALVVSWPGSDIDLVPTLPDGQGIDYTDDRVVGYYEGNTREYYVAYNDQTGDWSVDIVAKDVDPNGEPYELTVWVEMNDTDNDGLPDDWEREHFGDLTRDGTGDYDNDGMSDLEEYQHGFDPTVDDANEDADGDGYSNIDEIIAGTDPNDAESLPTCDKTYSVPGVYDTIQAAIDAAANDGGGEVCVSEGIYTGPIVLLSGVTLVAEGDPANTIIDGNGEKNVVVTRGNGTAEIRGFTVQNSGKNGQFSGIVSEGAVSLTVANCIIRDNGNGISFGGNAEPLIINNVITDNAGDGVRTVGNPAGVIYNNIIVNNAGEGISYNGQWTLDAAYNDIWNNGKDNPSQGNGDDNPGKGNDKASGPSAEDGNISADPLFVDPANGDYHLQADSPCIDTGHPDFTDDDGSRSDMGIYGGGAFDKGDVPDDTVLTVTLDCPGVDLAVYGPGNGECSGDQNGLGDCRFEDVAGGGQRVEIGDLQAGPYRLVLRSVENGDCELQLQAWQGNREIASESKTVKVKKHKVVRAFAKVLANGGGQPAVLVGEPGPPQKPNPDSQGPEDAYEDLDGDVNADGEVNIIDIMKVASKWNKRHGEPGYDPFFDADEDGDIDVSDIMKIASNWFVY